MKFIALILLAGLIAAPQQQQATIQGTVVKMGTGEPLPETRVGLVTLDGRATPFKSTTASDGSYTIANVPPGVYRLLAARNDGFLSVEYGQKAPHTPGTPIVVSAAQTLKDLQLVLLPTGAISGRVFDQDGEPLGHARVQALRHGYRGTERAATIVQSVETNDRGEFRLFWLVPGSYYISAAREAPGTNRLQIYIQRPDDGGGRSESRPPLVLHKVQPDGRVIDVVEMPTYFPNVDDTRRASAIALRAGDEIRGIDIRLAEPRPSRRISGKVLDGATGQPFAGRMQAIPADKGAFRTGTPLSTTSTNYNWAVGANGNFEFSGLVAGSYTLVVSGAPPLPSERHFSLTTDIGDKDVENLALIVPPSFPITGKVSVDGQGTVDFKSLRISIGNILTNITPTPVSPAPDGSFMFPQLGPGEYAPSVNQTGATPGSRLSSTIFLKSMRMGNIDLLREGLRLDRPPQVPLEIIIGTNPATVSGTVRNARNEPVAHSIVALVPNEKTISRVVSYRASASYTNGQFALHGLRPGDYRLYAWEHVEAGAWYDDDFMLGLQDRGTPVHVDEGGRVTVDVTAIVSRN